MNNPVNDIDENGNLPTWLNWVLAVAVIVAVSVITAGIATAVATALTTIGLATTSTVTSIGVSAMVSGMIVGGINLVSQAISNGGINNINFGTLAFSTFTGSVSGAFGGSSLRIGWQVGVNAFLGGATYVGSSLIRKEIPNMKSLTYSIILGGIGGFIGGSGAMVPGGELASAPFWKEFMPKTTLFTRKFVETLIETMVTNSSKGIIWGVISEILS